MKEESINHSLVKDDRDDKSVISDLTENSDTEIEDDGDDGESCWSAMTGMDDESYDSIDEIDEEELENLLKFSKNLQMKRCLSPTESPDPIEEENKRRKLNGANVVRNYQSKEGDNEVEQTADAIFSLFIGKILQQDDSAKSISTSYCSSQESSIPFGFHSNVFKEIAVDSSLNSFWTTILGNQA